MSGCPFHQTGSEAAMPSVMEVLKVSTQSMHDAAEGHKFQQSLVKGEITRDQYSSYLAQLLLVHRELESLLKAHAATTPAIASVVKPAQYQEPYLLEDLNFYGVNPATITPLASTSALISDIRAAAARESLSLLGFHYVMEGSNNGNKFIAKALARSFNLTGTGGMKYLDPYGDQQRPLWAAFKDDMNAVGFNPQQMRTMAEAAQRMFQGIGAVSAEMGTLIAV